MDHSSNKKTYHKKNYRSKRYHSNFDNYNTSKIIKRNRVTFDRYVNAMSGFGGTFDPITRLTYSYSDRMDKATAELLYTQDWLSRKIIETIPDDCTRKWIDIHMADEDIILDLQKRMKRINVIGKFKEAMINARLYGGSLIIVGIKNGQKQSEPLDYNNINDVLYLNVIDSTYINVLTYYKDPYKKNYGKPEFYRLNTMLRPDDYDCDDYIIHESRVIRFDGAYLTEFLRRVNKGWNDSILNPISQTLKHYGTSIQSGALLFQDFISKTLKMPNLIDLMQSEEGRATLELRLQYAIANFSSIGIVLLGEDEDFNKIQTPISGLPELIDKYIEIMAAASNIPRSRLFGQSLGTLAGATETTRAYYDYVTAYQADFLETPITIMITMLLSCKDSITKGKVPDEWNFKFNSLWDATDKEVTTARKMQAQSDDMYIRNKTLTPNEVAKNRFRIDGYSWDTNIDIENRDGEFFEENPSNSEDENNNSNLKETNQKK